MASKRLRRDPRHIVHGMPVRLAALVKAQTIGQGGDKLGVGGGG